MKNILIACVLAVAGCGGENIQGHVECTGASCVCPSSGDCLVDCEGTCDLQCAGSGNCDFICDADCIVACTGSGVCVVDVGDESDVSCSGSGACIVRCDPGFVCNISSCSGSTTSCPNGVSVCGGPCPAP
jgi:hypothetical protein